MPLDLDALRAHLEDFCGTAAASGLPAAFIDLVDIESMDGEELCGKAEDLGIDLLRFEVHDGD